MKLYLAGKCVSPTLRAKNYKCETLAHFGTSVIFIKRKRCNLLIYISSI